MGFIRKYIIRSFFYILYPIVKFFMPKISVLNTSKTINAVICKNLSIIRFGDGEFNIIFGKAGPAFQDTSYDLSQDLKMVLTFRSPNLLICIPEVFSCNSASFQDLQNKGTFFWKSYIAQNIFSLRKILDPLYVYGDARISRPYMSTRYRPNAENIFSNLKKIWDNKKIVIIEGSKTRFGFNNDLLDNSLTIKRIIAPAVNAYDKTFQIISFAKSLDKDSLFIIALGPAAKLIALELFCSGYQVLDLGHLDVEYEWFIRRSNKKIAIPGKYVNEVPNRYENTPDQHNDPFMTQVIADFSK